MIRPDALPMFGQWSHHQRARQWFLPPPSIWPASSSKEMALGTEKLRNIPVSTKLLSHYKIFKEDVQDECGS
jgi:hypothetical protein